VRRWTVGTHVGTMMGIAPTGRSFRFRIAFMLTFNEDHRIVEERRIYDFTGLLVQVGVLKAKPA
jgi:predicted ester cyclase